MQINTNRLRTGAGKFGVILDEKQLEKFTIFADKLREENSRFNLVGDADPGTILSHHFLDSLSVLCGGTPGAGARVLDLGSGAGMPGLVLAIAVPEAHFVLLDSSKKRTKFLEAATELLGLENADVICGRAEEAGRDEGWRDGFDMVTARAVAPLPTLVEYAMPFLKVGGILVAQRGPKATEETKSAEHAIRELRGGTPHVMFVEVPYLDAERRLVIIKKMGTTPVRYPRRTGVPLKRPL